LELDPKSYVICTYSCGSIRAPGRKRADKEGLSVDEDVIKRCLETMKRELDGEISAVIPTEMGGHNTAIAIHSAALLGLPAIDGDQAGRAAPELSQSTYQVHGVRATPAVVANDMGDMVVVHEYANIQQYERICRDIAVLGGGHAFVIDSAVNAKEVSKLALLRTVSTAISLGETVRKANQRNDNVIEKLTSFLSGYEIFHGKVDAVNLKQNAGFLMGTVTFEGGRKWKGRKAKIWVKNENIIAWRDGKLTVSVPDPILIVDKKGYGVTNSNMKKDLEVTIIGTKAPHVWRTPKGLELFGPRHFGFKFDFRPIELLVKT
jgi:DUF917 family protein